MTRTASLADLAGAIDAGPLAGFRNAIINDNHVDRSDFRKAGVAVSYHKYGMIMIIGNKER